ncbi:NAD(P)-dependent oxidoreductase [Dysgonomonas sp. OttesenSCG-928-M03]|nr:NAD(P)-dependent oxidoreductase [Dysgonomonas sp. OttesenSCG-928-M03]
MKPQRLAWIGLGHMGTPMSLNLIKAGYELSVYNRSDSKLGELIDAGAKPYRSVDGICQDSDIIFIMLSDDEATTEVFAQILNVDIAEKLFINMSTISPVLSEALAQKVEEKGGRYLEAPVSGSVKPAIDGTLIILAGGSESDYDQAIPFFEKLGKLSLLLGPVGQGAKAKLAINYYMSVVIEGLAETVLFAEKNGIGKETMMLIVNESACGSPMSKMKTPSILQDNYPAAFPLKHMMKDIGLAKGQGLNSPMLKVVHESYQQAMKMGYGDEDLMAVIKVLKN